MTDGEGHQVPKVSAHLRHRANLWHDCKAALAAQSEIIDPQVAGGRHSYHHGALEAAACSV